MSDRFAVKAGDLSFIITATLQLHTTSYIHTGVVVTYSTVFLSVLQFGARSIYQQRPSMDASRSSETSLYSRPTSVTVSMDGLATGNQRKSG